MNKASGRSRKRRSSQTPKALIIAVCVLLVILIALLVIFVVIPALKGESGSDSAFASFFDSNAQSGAMPGKTQEEIQAELNKIVEEGMFNISIASIVTMDAGDETALVRIENIAANHHNMTVTITLDDTGEVIYESAGLAPGQYIEYAEFNRALDAGEYAATATFTAYSTEDLSQAGQAAAKITIVVG